MHDYINHRESKLEGDVGFLQRKHLTVNKSSISYIGKESNELEETEIIGVDGDNYTKYDDIQSKIIEIIRRLKLKDVLRIGISKRTYYIWQNKIRREIPLSLKKKMLIKIMKYYGV